MHLRFQAIKPPTQAREEGSQEANSLTSYHAKSKAPGIFASERQVHTCATQPTVTSNRAKSFRLSQSKQQLHKSEGKKPTDRPTQHSDLVKVIGTITISKQLTVKLEAEDAPLFRVSPKKKM